MYLGRWITTTRSAPSSSRRSRTPPAAATSGFSSPRSRSSRGTGADYAAAVRSRLAGSRSLDEGSEGVLPASYQGVPVREQQVVEVAIQQPRVGPPEAILDPLGVVTEEVVGDELEI